MTEPFVSEFPPIRLSAIEIDAVIAALRRRIVADAASGDPEREEAVIALEADLDALHQLRAARAAACDPTDDHTRMPEFAVPDIEPADGGRQASVIDFSPRRRSVGARSG